MVIGGAAVRLELLFSMRLLWPTAFLLLQTVLAAFPAKHFSISMGAWRSNEPQNWSTKLLYMVKIGHIVTFCHTIVTQCHTLFELNGHFQYLVLFGLLNVVLFLAWTTQYGIGPSLDYSLW